MDRPLQPDLFSSPPLQPSGLRYQPRLLSSAAAAEIEQRLAELPLAPFAFHGFTGLRRVTSFGWRYDFAAARLEAASPIPDFLQPLQAAAAAFASLPQHALVQALITEYRPGAGIGWHRDRPVFGQVVGLSFGSPCVLRFRRRNGDRWLRVAAPLEPGSAYLLDGPARSDWEHSITPAEQLRYSVTFRTLRA